MAELPIKGLNLPAVEQYMNEEGCSPTLEHCDACAPTGRGRCGGPHTVCYVHAVEWEVLILEEDDFMSACSDAVKAGRA